MHFGRVNFIHELIQCAHPVSRSMCGWEGLSSAHSDSFQSWCALQSVLRGTSLLSILWSGEVVSSAHFITKQT